MKIKVVSGHINNHLYGDMKRKINRLKDLVLKRYERENYVW